MNTASYSGTPLAKKLGIKPDHRVLLSRAPDGFHATLAPLPAGVRIKRQARGETDVIIAFFTSAADLLRRLRRFAELLAPAGGLWIAWPKKASGAATDLAFDVVQPAGLALGLVDNKVCAIDETWSGLRFVIRVENRPKARARR
jgi:hypothetical protein